MGPERMDGPGMGQGMEPGLMDRFRGMMGPSEGRSQRDGFGKNFPQRDRMREGDDRLREMMTRPNRRNNLMGERLDMERFNPATSMRERMAWG